MKEVYDTLELKARRLPRTKTPRARKETRMESEGLVGEDDQGPGL